MRFRWLGIALLILGTGLAGNAAEIQSEPMSTSELSEKLQGSLLTIRQIDRRGQEGGIGSGFFISDDGKVATNLHVIGEGRPIRVTDQSGNEYPVLAVHAWSRADDIAILELDTHGKKTVPIELAAPDNNLAKGDPVVALGNPQGLENSVVEGIISGIREFDRTRMYQLAIPIEPGNSGGPLVDRFGRAHGMLTLKSLVTENLGFAVAVRHIHQLLEQPNSVSIGNWVRLGELNKSVWENRFGGIWKRRHGTIHVTGMGDSFGGRSLVLLRDAIETLPYEVSLDVRLDDESGAAGLVFGSDKAGRHWGFYPSSTSIRLTHFKGPDVYSWDIVSQVNPSNYRQGDWNNLRMSVHAKGLRGYLNGEKIMDIPMEAGPTGKIGLAKFRDTEAEFRRIRITRSEEFPEPALTAFVDETLRSGRESEWPAEFLGNQKSLARPEATAGLLKMEADALRRRSEKLENIAQQLTHNAIQGRILEHLRKKSPPALLEAALELGSYANPELDIDVYRQQIDTMAEEILVTLPDFATQDQRMKALIDYLFAKNGFRGSRTDYQNQANSFLSQVIDDREGLPISLSVLVMELGRRIFIDGLSGASFPGHFMVAWKPASGPGRWIDAFDSGKILSAAQVSEKIFGEDLPAENLWSWCGTPAEAIFVRMLRNLVNFAESPDNLPFLDLLIALDPDDTTARFQRAYENVQMRSLDKARVDFDYLLDKRPEGINIPRLQAFYDSVFGR